MSLSLSGIGVSRGIAIGKAHVMGHDIPDILEYFIPEHLLDNEVRRFEKAVAAAREQLESIRERIPEGTGPDIAEFIDTHVLMLEDATFTAAPIELIRSQQYNAEWAIKIQRDALVQVFEQMDDAYLRTRKDDVDHVVARIQRILMHIDNGESDFDADHLKGCILLAGDLSPADTVLLQHQGIAAFVTEFGAPLSHTAILARSLGIPAVVGVRGIERYIHDGELLIVDGQQGVVIAGSDARTLDYYHEKQRQIARYRSQLAKLKNEPAETEDGRRIRLVANIELSEDLAAVARAGAEGVGLYRTEFLYMNREDTPDEEEQLASYLEVLDALDGLPLTIRTLDLGADKEVDGYSANARMCANPALGMRAIRLCLKDLGLFIPQLRAIMRCSGHGRVRLMIPMLSNVHEVRQVLALIRETRQALKQEGLAFDPNMPVGGMIEVPAAALAAEYFAKELDFLSLGTNDLIQYTLAIDRVDDEVNYLYDPLHPAILSLIHTVIQAGQKFDIPVAMCGEMAGDPRYTRLLIGLGLTEFSMQPASLLEVKRIIKQSNAADLSDLTRRILSLVDVAKRTSLLDQIINHTD